MLISYVAEEDGIPFLGQVEISAVWDYGKEQEYIDEFGRRQTFSDYDEN